jgi:hypothetical protein
MFMNTDTELLVSCGVKTPSEIKYTYDDETLSMIEKYNAFWKDYVELCKKHGLMLESEDSYCGLDIVDNTFDGTESPFFNEDMMRRLSLEYKLARERWREWSDEKWNEECIKVFGEVVDFDIWGYLESDDMPPERFGSPALRKMIKEYQERRNEER